MNISQDFLKIVGLFILWRVLLTLVVILAVSILPVHSPDRYLGGGARNYILLPEFFAWGNFDGEHYLSISLSGYKYLEQAFFPLYPYVVGFLDKLSANLVFRLVPDPSLFQVFGSLFWGLVISNLTFLLALVFLWEIIEKKWGKQIAYLTIVLMMFFPTSFFFGAFYTESLFLLLLVLSYYFAEKGEWFWAGIFGALSSATRVFGILLLPALLVMIIQKKVPFKKSFWILLIPAGIVSYMYYLWRYYGDPFAFYHLQTIIGEQHQSGIIPLPQVYIRYLKMLFSVPFSNPIYSTLILEFLSGLVFFLLPIYGYFKKIPLYYLFFSLFGFLLPTIQGSFSSSPRYILVLFPSFLALALFIKTLPIFVRWLLIISLGVWLIVEMSMFAVGFWVA